MSTCIPVGRTSKIDIFALFVSLNETITKSPKEYMTLYEI